MSQVKNLLAIVGVDLLATWTSDGDFYWPDPTKFHFWNSTTGLFEKRTDASIADLPDHVHWHKDYVENQPLLFESLL